MRSFLYALIAAFTLTFAVPGAISMAQAEETEAPVAKPTAKKKATKKKATKAKGKKVKKSKKGKKAKKAAKAE